MTFTYLTLTPNHLDQVVALLDANYANSKDDPIRLQYSRDFIYWYLRHATASVGLCFNGKLVGMVLCTVIQTMVHNTKMDLPYPNFLCVRHELRGTKACQLLIKELKRRLEAAGYKKALFSTSKQLAKPHLAYAAAIIPINIPKLFHIGFLDDTTICHEVFDENPLKLLRPKHISQVATMLNNAYSNQSLRPFFDTKTVHQTLLPKKDIVMSFVRLEGDIVVDFVSVYLFKMLAVASNTHVVTANLAFVANTMNISVLIKLLVDKLKNYGVDQLMYQGWGSNDQIDVTRFTVDGETKYYLEGIDNVSSLVFYPI